MNSIKAIRNIRSIPPDAYRLPDDGRQWLHSCQLRRTVAMQLATYADADGSRIFPSAKTIARELGIAERTVKYAFRDLHVLGFLIDKGFTDGRYKHTRIRQLDIEKMQVACAIFTKSLVQSSENARAILEETLVQSSKAEPAKIAHNRPIEKPTKETDHVKPTCQPAPGAVTTNTGRDGRQDVRPSDISTKSENEKQRWLEFIKLLDEPMRGAWPSPDERKAVLEQLDQVGDAKEFAKAINDWACEQSPPITTLEYHRWTRWLETGVVAFEETKEYVAWERNRTRK